jgi:hypothetical protein
MRQFLGTLLLMLVLVAFARDASSAAIGSVVEQEGVTSVERQGEESDLKEGSDVEFMDTVKTGKGNLGITFIDDTNVAVSSQSALVIDDFVYDPNNADNSKLALKVAAGTVRYASGNVAKLAKQNVDIRTPTAKILVRGTAFSMTVDEIGQSLIILLPNVDGTVGEIDVESDIGVVTMNRAFQATSVSSREVKPTKPVILDLTQDQINNMLIVQPPKKKEEEVVVNEEKKKNLLDFDGLEENELDKNELDEVQEEGFVSLDINPLDVNFLLNVLDQLNRKYEKAEVTTNVLDGRKAGYNPDTLVTTLIPGDGTVIVNRIYEGSTIEIQTSTSVGTSIKIDQYGSEVPEITTDAITSDNFINVFIN